MKELSNRRVDSSIAWYNRFLHWVEHRWQAKSPATHRLFTTFRLGVSGLVTDFQDFVTVWSRVSAGGAPYSQLSYREISLLRLVPRQLARATPALCISALPGTVLLLPVLFYFPRLFLTDHFWTPEQRSQFTAGQLEHRRRHYASVADDLGLLRRQLESDALERALENVRLGKENPADLLASTADAFGHDCLQFDYLTYRHAIHLSRASGSSALKLYREYRLARLARLLYEEDRAVERANFSFDGDAASSAPGGDTRAAAAALLHQYCLARGVLACRLSPHAADQFVRQWCAISRACGEGKGDGDRNSRLSFLLHLPCLMMARQ